jgi:lipoate-protein ligase A
MTTNDLTVPLPRYDLDAEILAATQSDGIPRTQVSIPTTQEVVLGRGGDPAIELRLENVVADGVMVRRRAGGGCAVVLDPGNVIVAVAWPLPGLGEIRSAFATISQQLIAALARLGLAGVQQRGVSDLARDDRKIGGACIYRTRGLLYYATTLLVEPDLALVERYLQHPPREPAYRRGRRHRDFMGALGAAVGIRKTTDFADCLAAELQRRPLAL